MVFDTGMFLMANCEPVVFPFVMSLIGGDLSEQILTETLRKPKLYVQGTVVSFLKSG